ncbi:unnamed protein product [Ostreobium quekettii]|uniref:PsbP C-terminal domain-containing protein n=1 Tax=Ostreobium quekettii TaxID=121088 RepID=A0A8S1IZY3_9CHLO|nr:unnamed protein product [Ostreobium quekettii]|eukprot:evm.model.scf_1952.4 EVM.evm.TU.scf_1952.4   scf_1952:17054-24048(+)
MALIVSQVPAKRECWQHRSKPKLPRFQIAQGGWRRAASAALPPNTNDDPATTEQKDASPEPLDAVELIRWGGTLPSRRRAIQGSLLAVAIALGGNLGGISSLLLSLDGGALAGALKLDVVVPIRGLMRCVDQKNGFEFQYPASWLADQRLARRDAARIEAENPLDLPSLQARTRTPSTEPVLAFGPPGTTGEENVSAVVAPTGATRFDLADFGTPSQAGKSLLDSVIAPEGSGKLATLIAADSRIDDDQNLYYSLEYTVKTSSWLRHNLSVYAVRNGVLYTLNAQCPEELWQRDEAILRRTAASFKLS